MRCWRGRSNRASGVPCSITRPWSIITTWSATRRAAEAYGFDFTYHSKLQWSTYASLLAFARQVRADVADLEPRDQIDIQSFLWVLGSDEYPD